MIKTEHLPITEEAREEITKCASLWYSNTCVVDSKKPFFIDKDGDEIVRVTGFNVVIEYEVVK
jgi:hypothetical protein